MLMSWLRRLLPRSQAMTADIEQEDRSRVERDKEELAKALHDERGRLHWLELNRDRVARTQPRSED